MAAAAAAAMGTLVLPPLALLPSSTLPSPVLLAGARCPSSSPRPGTAAQAAAGAVAEGEKRPEEPEDDDMADSEYCSELASLIVLLPARLPRPLLLPAAPCWSAGVPRPSPAARLVAIAAAEPPIATLAVSVGESSICESCSSWETRKPLTDDCWDHNPSLSTPSPPAEAGEGTDTAGPLDVAPPGEPAVVVLPMGENDDGGLTLFFFAPPDNGADPAGDGRSNGCCAGLDSGTPVKGFFPLGEGAAPGGVSRALPGTRGCRWICTEGDGSRNGGVKEPLTPPPPCSPPPASGDAVKLPTACASCLSCAATYAVLETVTDGSCQLPVKLSTNPALLAAAPSPPPSPPPPPSLPLLPPLWCSTALCALQKRGPARKGKE